VKAFVLGYTVPVIASLWALGKPCVGNPTHDRFPCSHEGRIRVQIIIFWI